mmetsp:Transcript_32548/g.56299  ORF Transcript_32548/g.56299 Transcript_32548/m.56299 type:complete len:429 (+) Transcript_32548:1167-2453(+)
MTTSTPLTTKLSDNMNRTQARIELLERTVRQLKPQLKAFEPLLVCAEAFDLGKELKEVSQHRSKTLLQQQTLAVQHSDTIDALTDVFESIWGTRRFGEVQAASRHLLSAVDLEAELAMVEKRKQALLRTEGQKFTQDLQTASKLLEEKIEVQAKEALADLSKTQQVLIEDCRKLEEKLDIQLETYSSMQAKANASKRKATLEGQIGWILEEAQDIMDAEFTELERYAESKYKQLEQYFKVEVASVAKQVSSLKTELIKKSKSTPELSDSQLQLLKYKLDSLGEQARKVVSQCSETQVACVENVSFITTRAEVICRSPTAEGGAELQELLQGSLFEIVVLKKKLSSSFRELSTELASIKASLRTQISNKVLKAKAAVMLSTAGTLTSFIQTNLNTKHAEVAKLKERLLDIWEALAHQAELQITLFELTE